jgi:hypothetical protein
MEDNQAVLVALKYGKLPYTDETGKHLLRDSTEVVFFWTCWDWNYFFLLRFIII